MAALVFKVGALALKTLAKPLGDRFKNWVMMHPQYRQNVLRAAQVGKRLFTLPEVSCMSSDPQHAYALLETTNPGAAVCTRL
jgi:hypothetical protein